MTCLLYTAMNDNKEFENTWKSYRDNQVWTRNDPPKVGLPLIHISITVFRNFLYCRRGCGDKLY